MAEDPPGRERDRGGTWVEWDGTHAADTNDSELDALLDQFVRLVGHRSEAGTWLKADAERPHDEANTRILIADGRVQGLYVMTRTEFDIVEPVLPLAPRPRTRGSKRLPGSMITLVALSPSARPLTEPRLIEDAIGCALAGDSRALFIQPRDEQTADEYERRYSFSGFPGSRVLYIPLAVPGA